MLSGTSLPGAVLVSPRDAPAALSLHDEVLAEEERTMRLSFTSISRAISAAALERASIPESDVPAALTRALAADASAAQSDRTDEGTALLEWRSESLQRSLRNSHKASRLSPPLTSDSPRAAIRSATPRIAGNSPSKVGTGVGTGVLVDAERLTR